jgi:hypothetical protein
METYLGTYMKYWLVVMVLLGALQCGAGEIVVLTETPVAEFALPDGSVLAHAYVWRRSAQGLMIMHDGGSYFLNFKLLPEAWRAAYLEPSAENRSIDPKAGVKPDLDRYKAAAILLGIPDLDAAARKLLLGGNAAGEMDRKILVLGGLQNLLAGDRNEARRFFLFMEEKEYEMDEVGRDLLFGSCENCGGDGHLDKTCTICKGLGKCPRCDGTGSRESGLKGSKQVHCTTCRGTGNCLDCKGEGGHTPGCPQCKGSGKTLDRLYCEILRDRIVREVNAVATPGRGFSVASSSSFKMDEVIARIPALKEPARAFYLSEGYGGGMDTNLVVACFMHSLLEEDYSEAKRFKLMLEVSFPETEVLDVEKYLKRCRKCDATGRIERDCRNCAGSGACPRCEGAGERTPEIGIGKVHCTTCRGSGKCTGCGGRGVLQSMCRSCKGRGRVLERQRTEIKLGLLVDRLNEFYDRR